MITNKIEKKQSKTLLTSILIIMVIELVMGGSGRFLPIGPFTFRIFLYIFCIPISLIVLFLRKEVDLYILLILIPFTVLLIISISIGLINNTPLDYIYDDVKPLLFFYNILFFFITIKTINEILQVIKIIKYSALIMGVIYLILIILLYFNIIDFLNFYEIINSFGEVTFRGEDGLFLYKGFLYLCIGFFFFVIDSGRKSKIISFILLVSIILTLTRGFIISTVLVYIIYVLFFLKNKYITVGLLLIGLLIGFFLLPFYIEAIGDKEESNFVRTTQINQVIARTDFFNFFLGNGFGKGVPISPQHMEISYLEIFCKQGMIGLFFWFGLIFYIFTLFIRLYKNKKYLEIVLPCFLSVLFIVFQSTTNPFINNPIGLSMILITIVIYNRLLVI